MSVVRDIVCTYRAPRDVQERLLSGPAREDRALAVLLGACALIFMAQWPRLSREAFLDPTIAFDARLAGALFGWIMLMPLVFYTVAMVAQFVLYALGASGQGYASRMSLFWALLASTPLWLLAGLTAGFAGPGAGLTITSGAALTAFTLFWMAGLSVVMAQRGEGRA